MNNMNSMAEIQKKYNNSNVNLLMPVSNEAQINPFYKFTVMEVQPDLSDNSGDIFKVGSVKQGESYVDVFSPAKPLLMKLAAAAGIQFDPVNTYGEYLSKNCYKAKAYGAMRMPDGTGKTHVDEKVINLDDEEDRFRLEFMDKSLLGITDKKAADEAAKLFNGEWINSIDKWNKPCKAYKIADSDRQKYIDRSVLVNMTLLRKTFAEKAMTGAILRVIRALVGMKGTYTMQELKKPFVIPRVTFSPDYSNPEVRRAMLEQGMSSMTNMFGSSKAITNGNIPQEESNIIEGNFEVDDFIDNEAFSSDLPFDEVEEHDNPFNESNSYSDGELEYDPNKCSDCNVGISDRISSFSISKFGKPLCMKCQGGGK